MSSAPRFENFATKSGESIFVIVCAVAATGATIGAAAGVTTDGAAVVVVADVTGAGCVEVVAVVAEVVSTFAGTGFFIRSGKSFGATAAQSHRKPIEISTAAKIRFSISRDGVPTSRIERVAARQTAYAEPDAAQCAVLFDRLHHVNRAGRIEAAHRRQQRGEKSLVKTERGESEGAHGSSGSAALGDDALQGTLQIEVVIAPGGLHGIRLDVDDDVERTAVDVEGTALMPVNLAGPPFQTVAHVCLATFFGRSDADARVREVIRGIEQNAVAGKEFATSFVDAKELAAFRQSFLFRQSLVAGGTSAGLGWHSFDRQALAARAAAPRKARLAVFAS